MSPPTGAWTVRSWWLPIPGETADEDGLRIVDQQHPQWEPARRQGLDLACCRGTVAVVVYDPYGDVSGHWDRFSNVAHHLWSGHEATAAQAALIQAAWDEERSDQCRTP